MILIVLVFDCRMIVLLVIGGVIGGSVGGVIGGLMLGVFGVFGVLGVFGGIGLGVVFILLWICKLFVVVLRGVLGVKSVFCDMSEMLFWFILKVVFRLFFII